MYTEVTHTEAMYTEVTHTEVTHTEAMYTEVTHSEAKHSAEALFNTQTLNIAAMFIPHLIIVWPHTV